MQESRVTFIRLRNHLFIQALYRLRQPTTRTWQMTVGLAICDSRTFRDMKSSRESKASTPAKMLLSRRPAQSPAVLYIPHPARSHHEEEVGAADEADTVGPACRAQLKLSSCLFLTCMCMAAKLDLSSWMSEPTQWIRKRVHHATGMKAAFATAKVQGSSCRLAHGSKGDCNERTGTAVHSCNGTYHERQNAQP